MAVDSAQAYIEEEETFRGMVANIGHHLNKENKESLIFKYRLSLSAEEDSGLKILSKLLELGKFSLSNISKLTELLRDAGREDLANIVDEHQKKNEKKAATDPHGRVHVTQKDVSLRGQFDTLFTLTMYIVMGLGEIKEDIQKGGDKRRQGAVPLLDKCKEAADQVLRTLKESRSAARVSDSALALERLNSPTAEHAGFLAKLAKAFAELHRTSEPTNGRASPKATRKAPAPEVKKKPLHTDPVEHAAVPLSQPRSPLIPPHQTLPRMGTQSASNSPIPAKRRQSYPTKILGATCTGTPPVQSRDQHEQIAKEVALKLTHRDRVPVQETSKPEEDREESTGGSTGDSGFGDSTQFLKVPPVPPKPRSAGYATLKREGLDTAEEYQTVQREPVYEDTR